MDEPTINPESITIPRWTIKRDPQSLDCALCHSPIVWVRTSTSQMAFCSCRLVEHRLLPRPAIGKANSRQR